MDVREMQVVPKRDDAAVPPGRLVHLRDLPDFRIADPDPDVRSWRVVLPDGTRVGAVDDLLVDTSDMTVRYLEVKLDHDVLGTDDDTWRLVPVGAARLSDPEQAVVLDRLPAAGLAGAPQHARGVPTAEQERELREYYGPATTPEGTQGDGLFDHLRFWGRRRRGREGLPYLSHSHPASRRDELPYEEEIVVEGLEVQERVVRADAVPPDGIRRPAEPGAHPGSAPPDGIRREVR